MAERARVTFDSDLRRPRLAVLLRLPLALPPLAVLVGWTVLAASVSVALWLATVVRGRPPRRLHRLLRAYLQYALRVAAWLALVSRRYPLRRGQTVRLDATLEPQQRLGVLVRPVLALPGLVLGSAFGVVALMTAGGAWFVALILGRTTEGLRELGAFCLRYQAEAAAFLVLLTPGRPELAPPATEDER